MTASVTFADLLADGEFFDRHPQRRYHVGERWVTRRRGRATYLRAPLPSQHRYVDTEAAAERAWWNCAYPHLSPLERSRMARATRVRSKSATPPGAAVPGIPKVRTGGK